METLHTEINGRVSLLILDGMKELSVKKKYILKSIFPFLFITFALDNV